MKCLFSLCLLLAMAGLVSGAEEAAGEWSKPPADGKPWKQPDTGLAFPQLLGSYRLAGEYRYSTGKGGFIRYESTEERARSDIFFFPQTTVPSALEDRHKLLMKEMEIVLRNLEEMVKEGRYKNLVQGELIGSEIPLWHQPALPMVVRNINVNRLARGTDGMAEASIDQWVGITLYQKCLITIRHVRPQVTAEAGEEGLKNFISSIFQVIKDPALRADIKEMLNVYLEAPFSESGAHAATVVVAYLQNSPFFPINIPEYLAQWLQHAKTVAPGTEAQLIGAFMLGAATAAFDDGDAEACVKAGSKQFAVIYKLLRQQYPQLVRPDLEEFAAVAEKGEGAQYFRQKSGQK